MVVNDPLRPHFLGLGIGGEAPLDSHDDRVHPQDLDSSRLLQALKTLLKNQGSSTVTRNCEDIDSTYEGTYSLET